MLCKSKESVLFDSGKFTNIYWVTIGAQQFEGWKNLCSIKSYTIIIVTLSYALKKKSDNYLNSVFLQK